MTPPQRKEERPVAALLAPDILVLLEESPGSVAAETEEMHPADLADVAEALPREMIAVLLAALPKERAADVLEYLEEELRAEVLEAMTATQAASLVTHMTPDDRADVLEELEEEHAADVLAEIPAEARRETERLLAFDPESAGGIMTTEFVSVAASMTVEAALAQVRVIARGGRQEAMHSIYATDAEGRVQGVMSLRELLAAPEGSKVADVAWEEVVTVPATADRAEVAQLTREYDLVAVPVVDESSRIIGVVTVDDVIDALVEEQTEDVQKLGAVQPLEEPYFTTGFWNLARKRGGWLILLFIEEMFTGVALRHYSSVLESMTALMFFVPLIISSGGNSGSQSATLITRALAVGDVELRDTLRVFSRELGQGLALGAFLGLIGFGRALMWGNGTSVALVIAMTLLGVVLIGTLVGAMLPLIFTKLGFDPAIASSPFVASLVDVAGIVLYFMIAIRILDLH
ncbi:MAG TPA: magnesium transporter [Gemmatimonadaceae bacterium]|nr:magnesium transporter [Gemmatimonadaceae bacterium]